jgi:hypothetical protein
MIDSFHHSGAGCQEHGIDLDTGDGIGVGCFKNLTVLVTDGFDKEEQPDDILEYTL